MNEVFVITRNNLSGHDISFVDSHLHLDLLVMEACESVGRLARIGCLPVSWAFARDISSSSDLEKYLRTRPRFFKEIRKDFLPCFYLAGVHPRNIPPDLEARHVRGLVSPCLDDPLCLGIGEIGLETGSGRGGGDFPCPIGDGRRGGPKGKGDGHSYAEKAKGACNHSDSFHT